MRPPARRRVLAAGVDDRRVGQVALGGCRDEVHARSGRYPHQRVADVVSVAEVRDADALERAEALPDRHRVGERLERMGRVGEPVDDRDRRVLRELVDLGLVERADRDRAQEAREDERGVAGRLAARELEVCRRDVERHPAELGDPDLRADPCPRRRLAEDEPDGATGQDPQLPPARALDLELVREVERRAELVGAPVGDPREAPALERVGDPGHGAIVLPTAPPLHGRVARLRTGDRDRERCETNSAATEITSAGLGRCVRFMFSPLCRSTMRQGGPQG